MNNKKYRTFEVLIYFVLLFAIYVIQSTNLIFNYNSPAPSLILALTLVVSFHENYWFSTIFGLISGALVDSISANGVGWYALVYTITGFVCSLILETFMQNNFASFAVLGLPVLILNSFVDVLIKSGFTNGIFTLFFKFNILVAIYTFAAAFVIYLIFHFIIKKDERFKKPKGII